ncbi:SAM-dependent methyltransferase [Yinghuangia soli]|uniref:S-adenosyl-L-methionine-dependent methyltransferase n=1 Tax=Yinghuangia soli TaxID=2908204 RepID=A0AA41PWU7_9ACTN|nr:SAM-dependent methyltransferase [Yinghuangia soli]MCF2527335.1 SAM-dependent methyltransferase [Yinghuangia soli]
MSSTNSGRGDAAEPEPGLDPLARTALWTAAMRAREHARPDRLFSEPLAHALAGDEGPRIMHLFERDVQRGVEDPALAVRTRFLDEELLRHADRGIRQFVFVAAGMDTRAYRLTWPAGTAVYELDRPSLLAVKGSVIEASGADPGCARVDVGVDLLADWQTPLRAAGFDPGVPTAWLVEGLLYFLTGTERDTLLRQLADMSRPGSRLLADYVGQSVLDGPGMRAWRERMAEQGHPWKSGCDTPEDLLADLGWSAKVTAYGDPEADFGRWDHATIEPGTPGTRGRYLISATIDA